MGTKYKGNEKETRALDSFIKLMRATESITSRLTTRIKKEGLTTSQFGTLESLYHLGPLFQCDIAAKLLKSGGNITMVIDNLEKNKLVTRIRESKDRRKVKIHLTKKGETLIASIFPEIKNFIVEEMNILSKEEQEQFSNSCKLLGLRK